MLFNSKKKLTNRFIPKRGRNKKIRNICLSKPSDSIFNTDFSYYEYRPIRTLLSAFKTSYSPSILGTYTGPYGLLQNFRAPHGLGMEKLLYPTNVFYKNRKPRQPGQVFKIGEVFTGDQIFNLRLTQYVRFFVAQAPGTFCKVLWHDLRKNHTAVKYPSKLFILVKSTDMCLLGRNANIYHKKTIAGSAKGLFNRKKTNKVRGVAMNPVDHPNGGRANTKQPLKNPWGKIAKKNK